MSPRSLRAALTSVLILSAALALPLRLARAEDKSWDVLTAEKKSKKLADKLQQIQSRTGATPGGGAGFGTARGGRGMGGGTVPSPEVFAYQNTIQKRVKSEWRWKKEQVQKHCKVVFSISREGDISAVTVDESSGDLKFDDSVLNAISRAGPLPPPPASEYERFKSVRITFATD